MSKAMMRFVPYSLNSPLKRTYVYIGKHSHIRKVFSFETNWVTCLRFVLWFQYVGFNNHYTYKLTYIWFPKLLCLGSHEPIYTTHNLYESIVTKPKLHIINLEYEGIKCESNGSNLKETSIIKLTKHITMSKGKTIHRKFITTTRIGCLTTKPNLNHI